jgi:integrase
VYLYQQPESPRQTVDDGRRALVATLGCGGLRATEAAELDVCDVDLAHRRLRVRDSKTEAGVRDVDMTPRLVDELDRYLNSRKGVQPNEPAFPTRTGARRDRDNTRQRVIAPALRRTNRERRAARLPPIEVHVTPHTLRRTYISLMLAAGADVPYVQAQVGHTDPSSPWRSMPWFSNAATAPALRTPTPSTASCATRFRPSDKPRCQSMGIARRLAPVRKLQR